MSSVRTKKKILDASLELFNQHGLANVRLQMIADKSGISIGNLAYHFKNKEAIIKEISLRLQDEFLDILALYKKRNDFLDFDNQLDGLYNFVIKNPYYFLDALEIRRNFPEVPVFKRNCTEKLLYQIINRFNSGVARGTIKPEIIKGYYTEFALSIWTYIVLLVPTCGILNQNVPELRDFKKHIWLQFLPFLTREGKSEFNILINPIIDIEAE